MTKIDDAVEKIAGVVGDAHSAIAAEIQQVKDAIAAGNAGNADAAADRLSALADALKADVDALKADDPAPVVEAPPAPAPEPTPEPAPAPAETPAAS